MKGGRRKLLTSLQMVFTDSEDLLKVEAFDTDEVRQTPFKRCRRFLECSPGTEEALTRKIDWSSADL